MTPLSLRPPACFTARKTVICPAQKDHAAVPNKQAAVAVALTMSIAAGPVAAPPAAEANSYSDRLAAMQQRKQLLADARENAMSEGTAAPTGYDYLESMKSALSMKVPELPPTAEALAEEPGPAPSSETPAPAPAPAFKGFNLSKPAAETPAPETSAPEPAEAPAPAPAYKGFSWSRPAPPAPKPEEPKPADDAPAEAPAVKPFSFSRPAPAPEPEPAPAPAPAPKPFSFSAPKPVEPETPKVEAPKPAPPKVEAKKVEEPKVAEKSKKRKGPLPMALAQILLLAAYGGAAYLFLVKSDEVGKAAEGLSQSAAGLFKQLNPAKEESAVSK